MITVGPNQLGILFPRESDLGLHSPPFAPTSTEAVSAGEVINQGVM